MALSVLALAAGGGIWWYRNMIVPEREREAQVKAREAEVARLLREKKAPQLDYGRKVHEQALALLRRGEQEAAREKLTEIIKVYRDSASWPAARELLGEMNMDRLFDRAPMPGKLEYTVAPKDRLNAIASRFRTTVSFIRRVNNLLGTVIHPGERLVVYPLDFEVEVDLEGKRLTLLKGGHYFKDYTITGHHLPVSQLSRETTIAETPGWLSDKKVRPDSDNYAAADKWLQTAGRGSRSGVIFCPEPPPAVAGAPPAPPGIYLSREDMHELSTVVRPGIPLRFLKPGKS